MEIDNDTRTVNIHANKFMKNGNCYNNEMATYKKSLQKYKAANSKFDLIKRIISLAGISHVD